MIWDSFGSSITSSKGAQWFLGSERSGSEETSRFIRSSCGPSAGTRSFNITGRPSEIRVASMTARFCRMSISPKSLKRTSRTHWHRLSLAILHIHEKLVRADPRRLPPRTIALPQHVACLFESGLSVGPLSFEPSKLSYLEIGAPP